tara:strand:- start:2059 stop:2817 length:759 start_codon:yes stop_codon:yes gene_type:complete
MVTFSNADYSGPFESRYEEHEALSGERGNQAQTMAAQAQHSRGLTGKGMTDTSRFGTNRDLFGNDQFTTAQANPLNYAMMGRPPNPPSAATMRGRGRMARNMQQGSGGFLPALLGSGNPMARSVSQSGIGQFLSDIGGAYRDGRASLGMGIANLLSGGAFTDDYGTKMQGLMDMGYSQSAADNYIQGTQQNIQRRRLQDALYGPDGGPGIGGSSSPMPIEAPIEEDEEEDDDPIFIAPIGMAQGGLMSLRRR